MTDYSASQGCSRDDGCVRRPRGYSFDLGCETELEESHPRGDPDCSLVKVRLVAEKAIPRTSAGTPEARAGGDSRDFPTPVKHLRQVFPLPPPPGHVRDRVPPPPPRPTPRSPQGGGVPLRTPRGCFLWSGRRRPRESADLPGRRRRPPSEGQRVPSLDLPDPAERGAAHRGGEGVG